MRRCKDCGAIIPAEKYDYIWKKEVLDDLPCTDCAIITLKELGMHPAQIEVWKEMLSYSDDA